MFHSYVPFFILHFFFPCLCYVFMSHVFHVSFSCCIFFVFYFDVSRPVFCFCVSFLRQESAIVRVCTPLALLSGEEGS